MLRAGEGQEGTNVNVTEEDAYGIHQRLAQLEAFVFNGHESIVDDLSVRLLRVENKAGRATKIH